MSLPLWAADREPFPAKDSAGEALIAKAKAVIDEYHKGEPSSDNRIRLVYFHAADQAPLADWEERTQRIMVDIQDFYKDGLNRLGVTSDGLPFEMDGDRFKFHLVKGDKPANEYTHKSGHAIFKEMKATLIDKFDFSTEHVLALHGLCREEDGKYIFHAPYYGRGNQKNGMCHAADCKLLDPLLLEATDRKIVYAEHYYARKVQPLSLFNTWYLGGTAHELGHGISLPHNNGTPEEQTWAATSLMGIGNHYYRSDKWGGKNPSFLSRACVLRLVSSPLFTRSDKGRWEDVKTSVDHLTPIMEDGRISIKGEVESSHPVYAVIAYLWPYRSFPNNPGTDHIATTLPSLISEGGKFTCGSMMLKKRYYQGKISVIHVNGAATNHRFNLNLDDSNKPVFEVLKRRR